jgi:folylpolyglutamate synthase/dihydropteroate synthase
MHPFPYLSTFYFNSYIILISDDIDVILDIAHNEDAIVALINKVKFKYPEYPLKTGT